jgi:predicted nucleic acid-binding protein
VTIDELAAQHRRIAIDSNVLIYLFEGTGAAADAAASLVDAVEAGRVEAVLATVGLTEVLTRPASLGDGALFERYAGELRGIPHLHLIALDDEIAVDAAWGRSGDRDLGDAVHMATARHAAATAFVTNDRRVRARRGVAIVLLDELVPAGAA